MAVDFVVRSDAVEKRGGDDVQVGEYARALESLGVDARIVPFHPSMKLRQGAVTHVVNVDRPFEFLETCRRARGRIVVSPIHHDPAGVRAMRASERGRGVRSIVDRVMPVAPRELLAACVRAGSGMTSGSLADTAAFIARSAGTAMRLRSHLASALDRADAVALLAVGEGRVLRASTGWSAENAITVPNGMPDLEGIRLTPWRRRSRAVVVVGRVEPRKRQLELVRLAEQRELDMTIIGELQSPASRFGREFIDAVSAAPSVQYLGRLSHVDTLRIMADSRVLINASWVEVQSLVDIEAAAVGCFISATPAGHSAEWLDGVVKTTPDLHNLHRLVEEAARLAGGDVPPRALDYDRTWEQSAVRLLEAYAPATLAA